MAEFAEMVAAELAKARAKHRGIYSLHEGYAVVLEEMDELWDEVRAQTVDRDKVLKELVQVAAMCQRFAEDCSLRAPGPGAHPPTEGLGQNYEPLSDTERLGLLREAVRLVAADMPTVGCCGYYGRKLLGLLGEPNV